MRPSRKVLRALCALSFAGGAALLALGARASLRAHLGAAAGAFCALGALVALLSLLGFVGAGRDKSALLMAFFFLNFLLVASLVVACYAAFFSHAALETWLKHHWAEPVLAHLRETQAECQAFDTCATFLEETVTRLGAIGAAIVVVAVLAMYCVVRIVTVPIVMKSMLTVVNAMFVALGAGLFVYGLSVKVHADMISGQHWIAILLIVAGTLLVALSVLGVIGARAKSRTLLLIYLIGIGACLGVLIACAVSSFTLSGRLAATYESQWSSSSLSCDVGLYGCTNCTSSEFEECPGVSKNASGYWVDCDDDNDPSDSGSLSNSDDEDTSASRSAGNGTCWQGMTVLNEPEDQGYEPNDIAECMQCPEWSASDVDAYLRSVLHVLGLLALVVSLFVIVGMSGALVLRRSLAGYQTDSI